MKNQEFLDFVTVLKNNGFTVYSPNKTSTYANFVKDDKIGYFQVDRSGLFSFSSVHKPNSKCGTGYSIHRNISNPTLKMAEECFITKPDWADGNDIPIKYKGWAEKAKDPFYAKYIIL